MDSTMKTRVIRIGNSHGIRIPKVVLDQLGFGAEVEMLVKSNQLIIRQLRSPRDGWEAQFQAMASAGDDRLLPENTAWTFEEEA